MQRHIQRNLDMQRHIQRNIWICNDIFNEIFGYATTYSTKNLDMQRKFHYSTKFSLFNEIFTIQRKFHYSTKISLFNEIFTIQRNFHYSTKFSPFNGYFTEQDFPSENFLVTYP